jgi:hypothetical protein
MNKVPNSPGIVIERPGCKALTIMCFTLALFSSITQKAGVQTHTRPCQKKEIYFGRNKNLLWLPIVLWRDLSPLDYVRKRGAEEYHPAPTPARERLSSLESQDNYSLRRDTGKTGAREPPGPESQSR